MTVAWLALRELWISYRLMVILTGFVTAGAVVALLPADVATSFGWLAIGCAGGAGVAAAISAWSLASERRAGRAAWLVGRGFPRAAIVRGWFAATAIAALLGLVPSAAFAWVALSPVARSVEPAAYVAAIAAVGCGTLAAIAAGQLAGALLPRVVAVVAVTLVAGVVAGASVMAPSTVAVLPPGGHQLLAGLADAARPIGRALGAGGLALAITAALLVLAMAAMERADL